MLFDEFQSESNHYCVDEIKKLLSVHTSIARGNGEQIRYVPVFMLSNPVSIINPYYVELGISNRLHDDTKFLKGDGYVLENGFIETASKAQQESGMTVTEYCAQNGINIKTYYYRLRKVREQCLESEPAIVPVAVPRATSDIRIEKNGLQISLPSDISADTLLALVHELC
jgi:hypothetical protein